VEVGEGLHGMCPIKPEPTTTGSDSPANAKADLSSLSSMLQARWKGDAVGEEKPAPVATGQIRQFRIVRLDAATKKIELELA